MDTSSKYISPILRVRQSKGFGNCTTLYSYTILPPLNGEKFKTNEFHLNGSEDLSYVEIKYESEEFKFRLRTNYTREVFNIEPIIKKVILYNNGTNPRKLQKIQTENNTEDQTWITYKQPDNLNNPLFITFQFYFMFVEPQIKLKKVLPTKIELYKRMEKMYKEKIFADIKIKIKNVEFLTHKMILAKSPVFDKMIQKNERENSDQVFLFDNINPKAFEMFLKFLYLAEINDNFDDIIMVELIEISIMFQIEDLKTALDKIAAHSINIKNVFLWIDLANKYNLKYVNYIAACFIKNCTVSGIPMKF